MASASLDQVGRYRLQGVLGKGAMGTVYRAWDPELDRAVAIKVIQSASIELAAILRFRREAQTLAKLSHPNIATIFDVGTHEDVPFIVMEMIEGRSIAATIQERVEYFTADKLRMAAEICSALECAHAANVIHRDIKPANILITPGNHTKLVDFGLARLQDSSFTGTAIVVGTPAYLAPEAFQGREVDHRVDVYGVAACLYEWLCGSKPHVAEDLVALMALVVHRDAPDIREKWSECSEVLAECLKRGLARDPDARYQSAGEFGKELQRLSSSDSLVQHDTPTVVVTAQNPAVKSSSMRRGVTWIAAVAAVVVGAALLWPFRSNSDSSSPQGLASAAPQTSGGDEKADTVAVPTVPPNMPATSRRVDRRALSPASPPAAKVSADPEDEESAAEVEALPVGTKILATIVTELRSDSTPPGSEFEARLAEPLTWNGVEVVPRDTALRGIVDAVVSGGRERPPSLQLSLSEIVLNGGSRSIRTARYLLTPPADGTGASAWTLIIGVAVGAAVGGVVGGERGAAVGGLAGASIGASRSTGASEYVLGNQLTFKLVEPLKLRTGAE